ncbi:ATP-binding cassette domain-containing protein [Microbacterium sp. P02]|uniref:ABC transporter ATP-binding protein n=1 Tax=Microbacterium sp. P02 TaxID=3366260 RepID=UPI00366AFFB2
MRQKPASDTVVLAEAHPDPLIPAEVPTQIVPPAEVPAETADTPTNADEASPRPPVPRPVAPGPPPPLPADVTSAFFIPPRPPLPPLPVTAPASALLPTADVVETDVEPADVVETDVEPADVVDTDVEPADVVDTDVEPADGAGIVGDAGTEVETDSSTDSLTAIDSAPAVPSTEDASTDDPDEAGVPADTMTAPQHIEKAEQPETAEPAEMAEGAQLADDPLSTAVRELTDVPTADAPGAVELDTDVDAIAALLDEQTQGAASVDVDVDVPALTVHNVSKSFGETRAVDGIDLTVPAGTFYGLVGPNGAGKTTTLSMIAGLLRPDGGSISINGIDAGADPVAAKRMMGVLPDRLRTFDRLTGRQLLHYCGVLRKLPPSVVESRMNDLARAFDLTEALGRVVSDYSAGMAKKVMLAGAMIHSPRLLVLDEPFESVDPVSSAIILDILGAYVAHGGTVILSSHGMDLVERVCSRVAVIVAGQVLAEGTIDEVRGELTLEQRFIELAGGLSDVEGLEWLHTFSD